MSKLDLLTPQNCTVVFIDHQPQMTFGVANIDRQTLINNVIGLAKAARTFHVPVILTAVETLSFSGHIWPQLQDVFPGNEIIERSSMNSWEDAKFVDAVKKHGRKKLVMAALWTEVCLCFPALEATAAGYEVYAVADASGGTSREAHDYAMQRMVQAGVIPVTWQQVLLEFQRDWSRKETYNDVIATVEEHSGAYGVGVEYAKTMVHKLPESRGGFRHPAGGA
ncbi:MAG: hydrolase [Candidatus Sumerlaeia bacterium]|nr:hydrolase [Candidatus Sumerlaeia bacterium]